MNRPRRTVALALAAVGLAVIVALGLGRPAGEALLLLIAVAGLALAYRRLGATDLRDRHEAEWDRIHERSRRAPSHRTGSRSAGRAADGTDFPGDEFEAPFRSHRG